MFRILLIASLLVVSSDLLAKSPGEKTVPISGSFSGYVHQPSLDVSGCSPPEGICAWAVMSFSGWGTMSHLGESQITASHCSYGVPDDTSCIPDGTYGEGSIITYADNGDILLGAYENGISTPPDPVAIFMDEVTFVDGGTGRFTFASGGGVEIGSVNFDETPPSFTLQMTGEIAYKKK